MWKRIDILHTTDHKHISIVTNVFGCIAVKKVLISPSLINDSWLAQENQGINVLLHEANDNRDEDALRELAVYSILFHGKFRLDLFPKVFEFKAILQQNYVVVIEEYATEGTLEQFLKAQGCYSRSFSYDEMTLMGTPALMLTTLPLELKLSLTIRIFLAVYFMQTKLCIRHSDLMGNILITRCEDTEVSYSLDNGQTVAVCTYGYRPLISDFGKACMFNEDEFMASEGLWPCDDAMIAFHLVEGLVLSPVPFSNGQLLTAVLGYTNRLKQLQKTKSSRGFLSSIANVFKLITM